MARKKAGDYKVPFDKNGNLMHYAAPGESPAYYYGAAEWRENVEFDALVRVEDYARGCSAAYLVLDVITGDPKDANKRNFFEAPMFLTDFMDMLPQVVMSKATIDDWHIFKVRKRGQNYGLVMVK